MPPTAPTPCRTSISSKPPIPAVSSGSDPTRTAASVPSTLPSTSAPTTPWIGTSCARIPARPRASWMMSSTPTPTSPPCPQLKEAALRARRIGLGVMGLADLMYHVGVRYGSPAGEDFGAQVMEFVRFTAMQTSIELAHERGRLPCHQRQHLRPQPPPLAAPGLSL